MIAKKMILRTTSFAAGFSFMAIVSKWEFSMLNIAVLLMASIATAWWWEAANATEKEQ